MNLKKLTKRQKQKLLDKLAGQAMVALIVREDYTSKTPNLAHLYAVQMLEGREKIRKAGWL